MELGAVFSQWRTYTPKVFGNDQLGEPFTVQYKLASKGEAKRIEGLDAVGVDAEKDKFPTIEAHVAHEWAEWGDNIKVKQDVLLIAAHVGSVDHCTDGETRVTDVFQLISLLNGIHGGQLMRELINVIIGLVPEDAKKKSDSR